MRKNSCALFLSVIAAAMAAPAFAQEEASSPITISGSVALVSDYRFRGVSQSDEEMAVQGGLTISHESGFYVGTWGSNLSGWGTFGGSNMELDLFGGFKMPINDGSAIDVGLLWYMYPGGANETDFAELYAKLSHTVGPATLTAGVAYAPKQFALANVSNAPNSRGQKEDNLYISGDAAAAIPNLPITLKAHAGYSDGNPGLGPNGTSVAPTGEYFDWSAGADWAVYKNLTVGVSYVDTDISRSESAYLLPNFSKGGTESIADATVVFSISAAF
ncbi:hypothetical protein CLG96_10700 [Sphingomonas oleivorans]|uniref:Porin n=1 Tax=Sphingomonas oleivorans TaxID=1735121 RepID=A0A2T5FXK3_9SPHN|nr:TorF family putative porin [Sphingomonas oleivorans]PTQ10851.1 hypothetical protein CLG96_10700 [Sphingomonas oleivorans]